MNDRIVFCSKNGIEISQNHASHIYIKPTNKQFPWRSLNINTVFPIRSHLCFRLQVKESTWSDRALKISYAQSLGTLWVTTHQKNFSLHNCKLWYHMNFVSWDTPTLYSYLTNITNAWHVVPVLNGKHATPKWDTVSLKYKYKAHSVSYVILQSPTGREFYQILHQRHHYNESMQISAFPF